MKAHPAASLFPLLEGPEFDALVADIKKNGQQDSIKLLDGKVLDGRNRLRACEELGVEPWLEELNGRAPKDPLVFVWSANYHRRHLTSTQRGEATEKLVAARGKTVGGAAGRPSKDGKSTHVGSISMKQLSRETGVPFSTIQRDITNARNYKALPKPLREKVDSGEITVAIAAGAAKRADLRMDSATLPAEAREIFAKSRALEMDIRSLERWLLAVQGGFGARDELLRKIKWSKMDRAVIASQLDEIAKYVKDWKTAIGSRG